MNTASRRAVRSLLIVFAIALALLLGAQPVVADFFRVRPSFAVITSDANPDTNYRSIAADGSGGAFVTWITLDETAPGGLYRWKLDRIAADGTRPWATPLNLYNSGASSHMMRPMVVPDGSGGVIAARFRDIDASRQGLVFRRISAGGETLWDKETDPIIFNSIILNYDMVSDGAGGAYVLVEAVTGSGFITTDLYTQRISGAGAYQWGGAAKKMAVSNLVNNQTYTTRQSLATAPTGELLLTWLDARSGSTSDIYAQKISANGAAQWGTNGKLVRSQTTGKKLLYPRITFDNAGGAFVAYMNANTDDSDEDAYLQHITSAGTLAWTGPGVMLQNTVNKTEVVNILPIGYQYVYVTWLNIDPTTTTGEMLFMQKYNGSGVPQWADPTEVTQTASDLTFIRPVTSTTGEVILTFRVNAATPQESPTYAQVILDDGSRYFADEPMGDQIATGNFETYTILPDIIPFGFLFYFQNSDLETVILQRYNEDSSGPTINLNGSGVTGSKALANWVKPSAVTFSATDGQSGISAGPTGWFSVGASTWEEEYSATFTSPHTFNQTGYYALRVYAKNGAGMEEQKDAYLKIDNTLPGYQIAGNGLAAAQADAQWVLNSSISAELADTHSGIDTSYMRYSQSATGWPTSSVTDFTSPLILNTSATSGYFRIQIGATDNAGNTRTVVRYVKVDHQSPTIDVTGDGLDIDHSLPWVHDSQVGYTIADPLSGIHIATAKYGFSSSDWPATSAMPFGANPQSFTQTGFYRFEFYGEDNIGNYNTDIYYLKVDATAPTVSLSGNGLTSNSATAAWVPSTTVDVTRSDADSSIASSEYRYGFASDEWPNTDPLTFTDGQTFTTSGYYRFVAIVRDQAGNQASTLKFVKIDSDGPVVTWSGAGLNAKAALAGWVAGSTVGYSLADGYSGVKTSLGKHGFSATGWPALADLALTNPQSFNGSGYYRLIVTATDNLDNETSETRYLKIDNTAPGVTFKGGGLAAAAKDAAWVKTSTVEFFPADAHSGVATAEGLYGYSATAWPSTSTTVFNSATVLGITGYYRIQINITDAAGNSSTTLRWLKIDASAPVAAITGAGLAAAQGDAPWVSASTVAFSFSDRHSGIKTSAARYGFDAAAWPTASATSFTSGTAFTTPGYYRFEFTAEDNAGNTVLAARWLKINIEALTVQLSGDGLDSDPASAPWVTSSTVSYSASGTDAAVTAARYSYQRNSFPAASATSFSSGQVFTDTGYYRFEVSASGAGAGTATVARYLRIDTTPPALDVTGTGLSSTQENAQWVSFGSIDFVGIDADSGTLLEQCKFTRSDAGWPTASDTVCTSGTAFTEEGYYRIEVTARDEVGNEVTLIRWLKVRAEVKIYLPFLNK